MFLTLIRALLALQSGLQPDGRYPHDYAPNLKNGDEFDFIVVGSGSAGSVVANRLSQNSEWKVLLLEAGGYPPALSEIPGLVFSLQDTEVDWAYKTEPSETCCLGFPNKACKSPRGKALGGTSTINGMVYTRSTKHDHERWKNDGNDGWDHDTIVHYYKKFENTQHLEDNNGYVTDGELNLTRFRSTHPLRKILKSAYREMGYKEYTSEGDRQLGFGETLHNIHEGTRQSSAKAFLSPIKDRKNIYVATNSQVSKVLIDPDTLTAFGVEVNVQGRLLQLKSKKEVILSAGTFNSPHILMNSGIGPKEHLSELGIKVLKDLRVGDNYQDHIGFPFLGVGIDNAVLPPVSTFQIVNATYQYFNHRKGPLAVLESGNLESRLSTNSPNSDLADVQYLHLPMRQQEEYGLSEYLRLVGAPEDVVKSFLDYNQNSPLIIFVPLVLHPKSSGYVRLQNSNPFSKPLIIPNCLSDKNDEDLEVLLAGVKLIVQKLIKTEAFSACKPELINLDITNCREFEQQSDEFFKCAIRNTAMPLYHPVGTCKMGPASDASAVVDPKLRVHGVNNLRVIDASIMPSLPSCNTNAPSMMIGEKGADMVKKSWLNVHTEL